MKKNETSIDIRIREWKAYRRRSETLGDSALDEIEGRLREEMAALSGRGLDEDEAFLIAARRMENHPLLSGASRKADIGDFWKKFFAEPGAGRDHRENTRDVIPVLVLALSAALLTELPRLFGIGFAEHELFYLKNAGIFVLPFITIYFIRKRALSRPVLLSIASAFLLSIILINLYPFSEESSTLFLSVLHLPLCLWFFTGVAYAGKEWRDVSRRMDYLRFSGEVFIYTSLLFCGIWVISGLTVILFQSIDISAENIVIEHFGIPVAFASPVISAYLVDRKINAVENFAPILARIFAPLLLCMMLVFLGVMIVLQKSPFHERDFLIGFDLMLIIVLAIVFYIISTRKETAGPQLYDWINLALITVALIIDVVALSAIVFRLGSFGVSPNKLAALGENVLVFVNLFGMAVLYVQFMRRRKPFVHLEKWQTRLLPVYALWLGCVGLLFPLIFSFA